MHICWPEGGYQNSDGTALAARKNIVVVAVNYLLGLFSKFWMAWISFKALVEGFEDT